MSSRGGDALVLAPTGGGKSICFQVPALCRPGTAVVISPLIALMDDQVAALRQLGVAAGALHSDLEPAEARSVTRDLIEQQLDLLYVSPERLLGNGTLERLSRLQLALFAIDEAHCVSQWGHEFRPEYRALACLADQFPGVPRIALTATADPRTRDDILRALKMEAARDLRRQLPSAEPAHRRRGKGERDRAASRPARAPFRRLRHRLLRHAREDRARRREAGRTRDSRGRLPCRTGCRDTSARRWRGSVPARRWWWWRRSRSAWGSTGRTCASSCIWTCRTVPRRYYQQIGRAGRDGDPAETLLLYGGQDIAQARHWLAQSAAPETQKRVMRTKLEEMIALTEAATCRTRSLLGVFRRGAAGAVRPLRQLRRAAADGGCDGGGAEGAVGGVSHRSGVRRAAHHRRAARRDDRRRAAAWP